MGNLDQQMEKLILERNAFEKRYLIAEHHIDEIIKILTHKHNQTTAVDFIRCGIGANYSTVKYLELCEKTITPLRKILLEREVDKLRSDVIG